MKLSLVVFLVAGCHLFFGAAFASDASTRPKFTDYPIETHSDQIDTQMPTYDDRSNREGRDEMGKFAGAPRVNFAGRYYVAVHSCGAGCRYFSLSDLRNGRDSDSLDMFSSDERHPVRTRDGRMYTTELVTRSSSRLLIAQYRIEGKNGKREECRERYFAIAMDGSRLVNLSRTFANCS